MAETNKRVCLYTLSERQSDIINDTYTYLDLYGSLLLACLGILFNTLTIIILFNRDLVIVFFNRLLLCLSLIDNFYLIAGLLEVFYWNLLCQTYIQQYLYYNVLLPTKSILICCIIYLTVLLAFERYNVIVRPHHQSAELSWLRVLKYVGPIVFCSSAYNLPRFFEFSVELSDPNNIYNESDNHISNQNNCSNQHINVTSELRWHDEWYVLLYINISSFILTAMLPLLLLTYLNASIYNRMSNFFQRRPSTRVKLSEARQQNEKRTDEKIQLYILFAIVLIFVFCHALRICLNVEEFIYFNVTKAEREKGCANVTRFWALLAHPFSEIFLKMNSSINFFVYCFFNKSFRNVIKGKISNRMTLCRPMYERISELLTSSTAVGTEEQIVMTNLKPKDYNSITD